MKISIDTDARTLTVLDGGAKRELDYYSKEAFEVLSDVWLKTSWNQKYPYTFTWFGRPIVQHPEDMVRLAEVIYTVKPDVIVETGIAHGGSLVYYASILKAMGRGRVIGVDIEIRPHNRTAMEAHELKPLITMIEGSSIAPEIVASVKRLIKPGETVLLILDSNHSKAHVAAELEAYSGIVTKGSYIVSTDGIMRDVYDTPRGTPGWKSDNPCAANEEFLARHPEFVLEQPKWRFNESALDKVITGWPDCYLKRIA
ncbi:MAG TPA: CmcI family methyltransferase [Hyphomicrobiaceae bacterium]|nr:CmcI family methyltransferase [Hyphomicrobiaceae bacterium]